MASIVMALWATSRRRAGSSARESLAGCGATIRTVEIFCSILEWRWLGEAGFIGAVSYSTHRR